MTEDKNRLEYLLEQYAGNESTEDELKEFFTLVKKLGNEEEIRLMLLRMLAETEESPGYDQERWDNVLRKVLKQDKGEARILTMYPKKIFTIKRAAAAAIILLVLLAGSYFIFNKSTPKQIAVTKLPLKNDMAPGRNKAILTLSNGSQVILDGLANGTLAQQGNTKIVKLDSGRLSYNAAGASDEVLYNTISTPRGGQFQIILSDGSKVWLNAASSLRYPTAFTGKERDVELTGEGYFEVTHDAARPFKVSVNGMDVQVLGTHFNINAYDDESVTRTTLLEGSVKVSIGLAGKVIRPGEQAQIENKASQENPLINVRAVDVEEAIAWKNGRFIFDGNNIRSVMRQLSRWYDADVKYEGQVTDEEFVGVINKSRYENISGVLEMLKRTGTVSFTINGRSITVMPFKK